MKHLSRVSALRKQHHLSQEELAQLVGLAQTSASRLESGDRQPDIGTAFSYEVVFGHPVRELFPELYARVEDAVMRRAAEFERNLDTRPQLHREAKRRLLKGMIFRATRSLRRV